MKESDFGKQACIDLYGCNDSIKNAEKIVEFVKELCRMINMSRFGETKVVHFGEGKTEGYSMVQLIETSLISGHFANESNKAYIDIFSCRDFDEKDAAEFAKEFFGAEDMTLNVIRRK